MENLDYQVFPLSLPFSKNVERRSPPAAPCTSPKRNLGNISNRVLDAEVEIGGG